MLYKAQLPPSLRGEALATQIHIWNRLPMSSLKGMTPYEASFRRTRDVLFSHTWRNAYSLATQAVTRAGSSATPMTHKYLISEHAEFDERIFPGLAKYKATSPADLTPSGSLSLAPELTSVPMLDLEGDCDVEVIGPRIPHAELPLDAALPEHTPTPPASPAIVHAPLPESSTRSSPHFTHFASARC